MFGKIIDKIFKKNWSDAELKKYLGNFKSTFLAYSNNEKIREGAASGGTTTSLLITAIKERLCDGVILCRTVINDGKVRPKFFIAKSKEEILTSQGSKYVETDFIKVVPDIIRNFNGKLVVVGLPCDISFLKYMMSKDHKISSKIVLTIGLFCGHNSRRELVDNITKKLEKKVKSKVNDFVFRKGKWRGNMYISFENGVCLKLSSSFFNLYHNLFFFCQKKCLACNDHFGYNADISIGDVWLYKFKNEDIKRNAVIIRTEIGQKLFSKAIQNKIITSEEVNPDLILDGQSRIAPFHYNVSSRVKAGKIFGIKLVDNVNEKVRWNHFINAFITILNIKLSESKVGKKIIFLIPRFLLKVYLYLKKGLEVIK